MSSSAEQAFASRIIYEDRLHLACDIRDRAPDERDLADMRERNLHVLTTIDALEERRGDIDEQSPVVQELARIDNKLNVLMDIVTRLLVPDHVLPPRREIRMNAIGAEVDADCLSRQSLPHVLLRVHLDACRALPLEISAKAHPSTSSSNVFLSFDHLDDVVVEALDRFVFRHHRRKVAEARQSLT